MPPGPGPAQVTPEVAAAQLVADASQGATDGEAEQDTILEVSPAIFIADNGLMIVADVVSVSKRMSWPCAVKKTEEERELQEGAKI